MNTLKTGILMAGLTALVMAIGYWLGNTSGMVYAFVLAAVMNFFSYWYSDKMVLAMTRAQEVGPAEAPELYALVTRLTQRDNLPMPRLYLVPDPTPNAFATGRDPEHAAVAVNQGLLQLLNEDEVEGVIAHELSHVKHRDILISTIAATMAGALMMLSRMAWFGMVFGGYGGSGDRGRDDEGTNPITALVLIIVAPIAAMIIQLAISRSREYAADEAGGRLTKRPISLANALLKLERRNESMPSPVATPATAHMYIVNPLHGGALAGLFSTHPPIEDRVARLESLARQLGSTPRSSLTTERGLG
jgi:heat shock protein HtpX